jgi:hypothetical protein
MTWLSSAVPVFAATQVAEWLSLRHVTLDRHAPHRKQRGRPRAARQAPVAARRPLSTLSRPSSVPAFARAR